MDQMTPELLSAAQSAPLALVLLWLLFRTDRQITDIHKTLSGLSERVSKLVVLLSIHLKVREEV